MEIYPSTIRRCYTEDRCFSLGGGKDSIDNAVDDKEEEGTKQDYRSDYAPSLSASDCGIAQQMPDDCQNSSHVRQGQLSGVRFSSLVLHGTHSESA